MKLLSICIVHLKVRLYKIIIAALFPETAIYLNLYAINYSTKMQGMFHQLPAYLHLL